jgi:hypothetical protein
LSQDKLARHLSRFQAGALKHEEIFDDEGHGCAIHPDYLRERPFTFTVITGPRRSLARGWPGVFAAPLGDMMLTGCFGLTDAWLATGAPALDAGGFLNAVFTKKCKFLSGKLFLEKTVL